MVLHVLFDGGGPRRRFLELWTLSVRTWRLLRGRQTLAHDIAVACESQRYGKTVMKVANAITTGASIDMNSLSLIS